MTLEPRDLPTIASLIKELSTELDLHYDDADLPATEQAITALKEGADILTKNCVAVPEATTHILARYARVAQ